MRRVLWVIWLCCATISMVVGQEPRKDSQRYPYDAHVVHGLAAVRSGPGEEYYLTATLPQGTRVVVYKQAPGGWLAIEPPAESFCWVSADRVWKTSEADVGEVIGDEVISWIGSSVDNVTEHRWQVRLHAGERIQLLGEKQTTRIDGPGESTWYRIAPPSGEFRWIRDLDVLRQRVDSSEIVDGPPRYQDDPRLVRDALVRPAGWGETRGETRGERQDDRRRLRGDERPSSPRVASLAPRDPDRIRELDRRSGPGGSPDSPYVSNELASIEAEMGLMIAKEPSYWDFVVLRERLQKVIDGGSTPLERGRARRVLDRVNEFDQLRQRQVKVDQGVAVPPPARLVEHAGEPSVTSPTGISDPGSRLSKLGFEATGQLRATSTQDKRAPQFALVDEQKKIQFLLVPAPGVNLRLHEMKNVGIKGHRAGEYRPLRQPTNPLPVLVVENAIELDRHAKEIR